ncbi:MAG: hypothetical protein WC435_00530 [Candidatus Paceibacterota bacterium]
MKEKAKKIWSSLTGLISFFGKVFGGSEKLIPEQLFLKDILSTEWPKGSKRNFEERVRILQRKAKIVLNEIEVVFIKLQKIMPLLPFRRRELEIMLMKGDSVWEVAQAICDQYQLISSVEAKEKLMGKFSVLKEKGFLTANLFVKEEGGDRSYLFPWEEQYVGLQEK